jgi:hypothetical protein
MRAIPEKYATMAAMTTAETVDLHRAAATANIKADTVNIDPHSLFIYLSEKLSKELLFLLLECQLAALDQLDFARNGSIFRRNLLSPFQRL